MIDELKKFTKSAIKSTNLTTKCTAKNLQLLKIYCDIKNYDIKKQYQTATDELNEYIRLYSPKIEKQVDKILCLIIDSNTNKSIYDYVVTFVENENLVLTMEETKELINKLYIYVQLRYAGLNEFINIEKKSTKSCDEFVESTEELFSEVQDATGKVVKTTCKIVNDTVEQAKPYAKAYVKNFKEKFKRK